MLHIARIMARPTRLRSFSYIGLHRYSLTLCTMDRGKHFVDEAIVASSLVAFLTQARVFSVAVFAYCFMPDHVHLLAEGLEENADLQQFVAESKKQSGFAFRERGQGKLWQRGYWDRVLRDEEETIDVARYIVNNPVRAGLVEDPRDYPFLGSGVYHRAEFFEWLQLCDAMKWRR